MKKREKIKGLEMLGSIAMAPLVNLASYKRKIQMKRQKAMRSTTSCTTTMLADSQRKRQIRLAVIMSFTVLEFNVFYLPMFSVIIGAVLQKATGYLTMPSEYSTMGFSLWLLDSIFNPLWTTILSTSKRSKIKPQFTLSSLTSSSRF